MGYQSNFISNVNLMVMLLAVCLVLYLVLTFFGNRSDCYITKPKLLKYGKAFIYDVPLTILLFSSFNIYSSLVIEIKYLGTKDPISLPVAIVVSLLLPAYATVLALRRNKFSEFREEFN